MYGPLPTPKYEGVTQMKTIKTICFLVLLIPCLFLSFVGGAYVADIANSAVLKIAVGGRTLATDILAAGMFLVATSSIFNWIMDQISGLSHITKK